MTLSTSLIRSISCPARTYGLPALSTMTTGFAQHRQIQHPSSLSTRITTSTNPLFQQRREFNAPVYCIGLFMTMGARDSRDLLAGVALMILGITL